MADKVNKGTVKVVKAVVTEGNNVTKGGRMSPAPTATYIDSTPPASKPKAK